MQVDTRRAFGSFGIMAPKAKSKATAKAKASSSSFPLLSVLVALVAIAVTAFAWAQPEAFQQAVHTSRARALALVEQFQGGNESAADAGLNCNAAHEYLTDVHPVKGFHVLCVKKTPTDTYVGLLCRPLSLIASAHGVLVDFSSRRSRTATLPTARWRPRWTAPASALRWRRRWRSLSLWMRLPRSTSSPTRSSRPRAHRWNSSARWSTTSCSCSKAVNSSGLASRSATRVSPVFLLGERVVVLMSLVVGCSGGHGRLRQGRSRARDAEHDPAGVWRGRVPQG